MRMDYINNEKTTCGTCRHFTGAGDYDLCCKVSARRLCYEDSPKCEQYEHDPDYHKKYEEVQKWYTDFMNGLQGNLQSPKR